MKKYSMLWSKKIISINSFDENGKQAQKSV